MRVKGRVAVERELYRANNSLEYAKSDFADAKRELARAYRRVTEAKQLMRDLEKSEASQS